MPDHFGLALRRFRLAARLTKPLLAERMNATTALIARWEAGRELPAPVTAHRLDKLLNADGTLSRLGSTTPVPDPQAQGSHHLPGENPRMITHHER